MSVVPRPLSAGNNNSSNNSNNVGNSNSNNSGNSNSNAGNIGGNISNNNSNNYFQSVNGVTRSIPMRGTYVCMYACICIINNVRVCVYFVCMCVSIYICVCVCIYLCVCMYVCMYVCVYVFMCVCVCARGSTEYHLITVICELNFI